MKNYFSKPAEPVKTAPENSTPKSTLSSSNLAKLVEQTSSQVERPSSQNHPALRLKGLENDFSHKPLSNVDEQLEQDLSRLLTVNIRKAT